MLYIKGAPDYLIKNSTFGMLSNGDIVPLDEEDRKELTRRVVRMAGQGLRTLAVCIKMEVGQLKGYNGIHHDSHPVHNILKDTGNFGQFEQETIFLGVVGIKDAIRKEVPPAIAQCRRAGVNVIMITGDIKETAGTIGKECGIVTESTTENTFTGEELELMSDNKRIEIIKKALDSHSGLIFSRTEPRHKKLLVSTIKKLDAICAMTGDGVNDAPALQLADIGIAMGIAGCEVAKEASSMVLADDNFSTIVEAISEGRAIFANMKVGLFAYFKPKWVPGTGFHQIHDFFQHRRSGLHFPDLCFGNPRWLQLHSAALGQPRD
jgi:Ca2+-transporting ATPase